MNSTKDVLNQTLLSYENKGLKMKLFLRIFFNAQGELVRQNIIVNELVKGVERANDKKYALMCREVVMNISEFNPILELLIQELEDNGYSKEASLLFALQHSISRAPVQENTFKMPSIFQRIKQSIFASLHLDFK